MAGVVEPVPPTPSARWALAVARAEGAVPAGYDFVVGETSTVIHWRQPVEPGGYDTVEIGSDGHTFYRLDAKLHRLDGPAVVHVTRRLWFIHGKELPDRRSWYRAAVLAHLGLDHISDYIEAAIHAELTPAQAAAGYREGIPVAELRSEPGWLDQLR